MQKTPARKSNKKIKTTAYDSAEYLTTPEAMSAYMDETLATGDAGFIAHALGVVARARGMSQIARDSGLSRESLYKAMRIGGNPEFGTVLRVMQALDLRFSVAPVAH